MGKNPPWVSAAADEEEFFGDGFDHTAIGGKTAGNDGVFARRGAAKIIRRAAVDEIEQGGRALDVAFEKEELRQHVAFFEIVILGGKASPEVMLDDRRVVIGLF
jgi:hypothetical protein